MFVTFYNVDYLILKLFVGIKEEKLVEKLEEIRKKVKKKKEN